jgi:hypothetical protein
MAMNRFDEAFRCDRHRNLRSLLPNIGGVALCAALAFAVVPIAGAGGFAAGPSMDGARAYHAATVLANGKVLVTGGSDAIGDLSSAEIYDPANNAWGLAASMSRPRSRHTSTLLGNGKVLVTGGVYNTGATPPTGEVYDPATNTWAPTGVMGVSRGGETATLLPNGKVLIAGGVTATTNLGTFLLGAELYDPA